MNRIRTDWKYFKPIVKTILVGLLAIAGVRSIVVAGYRNMGNLSLLWGMKGSNMPMSRIERAERYLERAISFDPDQLANYCSLGKARVLEGDHAEAESAFLESRADSHVQALQMVWLLLTGERNLHQQRYEEALRVRDVMARLTAGYRGVAELSCESKTVEIALGKAWRLGHEGDRQAEEIAYQLVVALAPSCPGGYYRSGGLYYAQQRYEEAGKAYRQGIAVDSKTIACGYEYLAGTYMELGQLDEVVEAVEAALQHGGGPQATMLLGRVYQLRNDLLLAQDYYLAATQQASECDQDNWSRWMAYFYMGWMAFERKEYDLALFYMRQASQVIPGAAAEAQALKYVGDMYKQRGMLPEAIQEYEMALKLAPPEWDWVWRVHLALADAYRDSGYKDEAIGEYRTVLGFIPHDESVKRELDRLESGRQ